MFGLYSKKEPCCICWKKSKLDSYDICENCNKSHIDVSKIDASSALHISIEFFALHGKEINEIDIPMVQAYRNYRDKYTKEDDREGYYQEALQHLEKFKQFYESKGLAGRVAYFEKVKKLTPDAPKNSLAYTLYNMLKEDI